MEIFDIVDENGTPVGSRISRTEAHAKGIRHRTAHIWVVKKDDENEFQVLLQKRSYNKDSFPGCYDTSSAGHIHAGDEPLASARRELYEELGIKAEEAELRFAGNFTIHYKKEFHGSIFHDHEIAFVYVYDRQVEDSDLILQKEEVDSAEWFPIQKVIDAVANREAGVCVPSAGLAVLREFLEKGSI